MRSPGVSDLKSMSKFWRWGQFIESRSEQPENTKNRFHHLVANLCLSFIALKNESNVPHFVYIFCSSPSLKSLDKRLWKCGSPHNKSNSVVYSAQSPSRRNTDSFKGEQKWLGSYRNLHKIKNEPPQRFASTRNRRLLLICSAEKDDNQSVLR